MVERGAGKNAGQREGKRCLICTRSIVPVVSNEKVDRAGRGQVRCSERRGTCR
jgi:hypothetical protein